MKLSLRFESSQLTLGVLDGHSCSRSVFITEGFVEEAWARRLASPDILVMLFRQDAEPALAQNKLKVIWLKVLLS